MSLQSLFQPQTHIVTIGGPSPKAIRPNLVLVMDVYTLNDLLLEGLTPAVAVASGRLSLTGDLAAADQFARVFGANRRQLDGSGQREGGR